MILYTWVGEDGLVRWSDELPTSEGTIPTYADGVVATIDGRYDALIGSGLALGTDVLDRAMALAFVRTDFN